MIAVIFGFTIITQAQTAAPSQPPKTQPAASSQTTAESAAVPEPKPLSPAELMRTRVSKAKAYIAVRNYNAAIAELESIRRDSNEPSVESVASVLLMNSYIEQGNYRKALEMLNEHFRSFKANNANASMLYSAVAGQVIKASRSQIDRYRGLGLSVSERGLPLEAVNDIEQMRVTLELVISQAKEVFANNAHADIAVPLLEEAVAARSILGRDDYDSRRWRDEMADVREQVANSRSVILNAVIDPNFQTTAAATQPASPEQPVSDIKTIPSETSVAAADKNAVAPPPVSAGRSVLIVGGQSTPETNGPVSVQADNGPLEAGSLIAYAVRQQQPIYPAAARQLRTTGVVRVEIEIDENGEVAEIDKTSGPTLLQPAARDAIRKWRFKPFTRDGRPVRATGYVNFNFSL